MKRAILIVVAVALLAAGGASAYALAQHTIFLKPGHCRTIRKVRGTHTVKVCAKKVQPHTVTVSPSPIGETFSGNGSKKLDPMTLSHGVTVKWKAQPDAYGYNFFSVLSSPGDSSLVSFNNGTGSTSGTSYIPAGTYTFNVSASGAWTLSF